VGTTWRTAQRGDDACREEGRVAEARLVEGLRRRAPEALAGLHEQYAAGIYSLALRVVRHAHDAEDITHDVLIRAYERLPRDREVLLRPWLYRLTLNRCYDHLRWSARRPLLAHEHDAPSPGDPYEQSELQALLEASLDDLTRRQRAAILLKDVHGLSLVEVAACLEVTPGSVEVLLARARRAFRASFEERSVAAGRPVPGSAGALVSLPLLPLPLGLAAPPLALPAAPLPMPSLPPIAPLAGGPLAAATGGGIGALLGLPSSVKTAVMVAAAAASLGSAELIATSADQRPSRPDSRAVAASAGPVRTSAVELSASHASSTRADSSPSPRVAAGLPSPAASPSAEPSPQDSPLGIVTPSSSPSPAETPDVSPSATSSPDPHATPPTPAATVSASPSPSPDTGDSPSPAPSAGP
jgi:RNA polymerase sigma-70 factor (ECF subfamily)